MNVPRCHTADTILMNHYNKMHIKQLLELDILRFSLGKPVKIYAAQLIDKSTTVIFEDKN